MKRRVVKTTLTMLFLSSMLIGTFEIIAASGVELAYDNDELSGTYPFIGSWHYLRQRFLVSDFGISEDCMVETVRIFWWGAYLTGVIELRDYETGAVATTASLGDIPPVYPGQWYDYDISGSGFVSDHFYVELWVTSLSPSGGYIGQDTDTSQGVSEHSSNAGQTWSLWDGNDFLIRVIVTPVSAISATIDCKPERLVLKGNAPWIITYVELPSGYDIADIDFASIEISCDVTGGINSYEAGIDLDAPSNIGDYDGDGVPDLMVMFDRLALVDYLEAFNSEADGIFYNLPITITGMVSGTPFEGIDTISVLR